MQGAKFPFHFWYPHGFRKWCRAKFPLNFWYQQGFCGQIPASPNLFFLTACRLPGPSTPGQNVSWTILNAVKRLQFKKRQEYFPHHLYPFVSVFGCFWYVLDGQEDCWCRMLILGQGLLPLLPYFHGPLQQCPERCCSFRSKTIEKMTGSPSRVATFIPVLSTCESISSCNKERRKELRHLFSPIIDDGLCLMSLRDEVCHPLHYFR